MFNMRKMHRYLKALFVLPMIFLTACEPDSGDEIIAEENLETSRLKFLTLEEFSSRIDQSKDFNLLSTYFDVNKSPESLTTDRSNNKGTNQQAAILTDEIAMVEVDSVAFYTLKIIDGSTADGLQNLVLHVDSKGEIVTLHILEYTPSTEWLLDTSQHYSGEVTLKENTLFNFSNINDVISGRGISTCITGISYKWDCNAGYEHAPNTCTAGGSDLVITYEYGTCTEESEENATVPNFTVGGSGGGGGSAGGSIPTDTCEETEDSISLEIEEECDNGGVTTPIVDVVDHSDLLKIRLGITDLNVLIWLSDINKKEYTKGIYDFIKSNNFSPLSKQIARDVIYANHSNTSLDLNAYDLSIQTSPGNDVIYQSLPEYLRQPNDPFLNDTIILEIVGSGIDGIGNILFLYFQFVTNDENEGIVLRWIMNNRGDVDLPDDIDNATLGQIFQLRKRNRGLSIEYKAGFLTNLLELGISTLDVFAILSPSKGAGAFLLNNTGRVTAKALSDYLKALSKGKWVKTNEFMSDAAAAYQSFVTEKPFNISFLLNNVKFDGIRKAVMIDAKSGMLNFVDNNGNFLGFFTGEKSIVDQARRQLTAADGLPIEWHFQHENVRKAFEKLLNKNNIFDIILVHTPN